jgi:hypothetical protein
MDALVELNVAWSVSKEIREGDRAAIAKVHDILKNELNKDQYKRSMERSKLIIGEQPNNPIPTK